MRYEMRLTAYDMLDSVVLSLILLDTADRPPEHWETRLALARTIRGEGVSDPREWARDALVAMLEAL